MVNKKSYASIEPEDNTIPEVETSKEFINFFVNELKEVYWAERHQLKLLPKMHKATTAYAIKDAFENRMAATALQIERLEQTFELLSENPKSKKCEAVAALADELSDIIDETEKGSALREAGLVLTAQKIENYEIMTYGALVQLARTMGNEDIISLLEEILTEEIAASEILTTLSEKIPGAKK